jgi:hypothetical protein
MNLVGRLWWAGQVVVVYLLAEFAIYTIAGKVVAMLTGGTANPWMGFAFIFLPLTVSAIWMLSVLFSPLFWDTRSPKGDAGES